METSQEILALLEQIQQPVFLVKDGKIAHVNHEAQIRQIGPGIAVKELIAIGATEYQHFVNGRLLLTLKINQAIYNASVVKSAGYDVFYLESEFPSPELRALALAAQNLRDPLSSAMLSIDNLSQKTAEQSSSALTEDINKLRQQLHRLQRLVGNMSDASQYDQKRGIKMENRDAVSIIKEIVDKAAELTEACHCQFEWSAPAGPVFCMIDAEKLERALWNLISNAIRHSAQGGTIKVSLQLGLNKLYLSVQNAQQIAESSIYHDLFFRFLREPGLESNGIGLGLTLIRGAAAVHNGTVLIEHPNGEGLKFTMSLALEPSGKSQLRSPTFIDVDYSGGFDRALIELSDILPPESYQ